MSKKVKSKQQELMEKFIEDKKKNSKNNQSFLRAKSDMSKSNSKTKGSHNGGGFFDK